VQGVNPGTSLRRLRDGAAADAAHGRALAKDLFRKQSTARQGLIQVLKASGAAVLAWWLTADLLDLPLPYVAPMAAMIMVRNTVYWSMLTGVRQVVAVAFGAVVADLALHWAGNPTLALALALPPTLLIGRFHRLDDQGVYAPMAALFLIAFGGGSEDGYIGFRLLETGIGAVIGTGVNLLILPPTHLDRSWFAIRRTASAADRLLRDVADGLRGAWDCERASGWSEHAEELNGKVEELRDSLRQGGESLWLNPRAPSRRNRQRLEARSGRAERLGRVAATTASLVGILRDEACNEVPPAPLSTGFAGPYAQFLDRSADALNDALAGRTDADTAEALSLLLAELEREVDGTAVTGAAEAELHGSLLLTARQLHRDITG
jgi:uncharacterized membrane protein YccC